MNQINVLLVSPLRNIDPNSGDVTFTEQLVISPPEGVKYTTYADAIGKGVLVECGTRQAIRNSSGREFLVQIAIALWRKFEFLARQSGLMFREPLRVFRVLPNSFDIVHVHTFHTVFLGKCPARLISLGGPLEWLYLRARNWSRFRVNLAVALDRLIGRLWKADMFGNHQGSADLYIVPNIEAKKNLISKGWKPLQIEVIPNILAIENILKRSFNPCPKNLIFIGRDFVAKGGDIALEAFQQAQQVRTDISLTVVGPESRDYSIYKSIVNLHWLGMVSREKLMNEILPTVDILVYPSRFDTGLPYAVIECLSSGIPVIVSNLGGLPAAAHRGSGIVVPQNDSKTTAEAILELLDPVIWNKASHASSVHFETNFSAISQSAKYNSIYRRLILRSK